MSEPPGARSFEAWGDGMLLGRYDPAYFTSAAEVIACLGREADVLFARGLSTGCTIGICRGDALVATARWDEASGAFIPGPPKRRP